MDKSLNTSNLSGRSAVRRRKFLTTEQILEELLQSDTDDEVETVVVIPPEAFDGITDEEDIDEEVLKTDESLEKDIAGTFEMETRKDCKGLSSVIDDAPAIKPIVRRSTRFETSDLNDAYSDDDDDQPSTSAGCHAQNRKPPLKKVGVKRAAENESNVAVGKYKLPSAFETPKWKEVTVGANLAFEIVNTPDPLEHLQLQLQQKFKDKLPSDIFSHFFDNEVCKLIVTETKRYAMQHNDTRFSLTFDIALLKRFIGILILSGYYKLPQIGNYWSTNPTLGVPIVQQTMSRNMFRAIKQNLHFQDNSNLDRNDKYTKVRSLFDIINEKFMQFGVFEEHLAIDEQMLPYFGRHSCKMYMKSKPIKVGFKTWCMAASSGYVFRMLPYGGANDNYDKNLGLSASVVMDMVSQLKFPARHQVYFDNFFTSHYLMCLLVDERICATGTVRSNCLGRPAPDLKTGKQLPKGKNDAKFDTANKIVCCRWQDKREVTLLSNFTGIYPTTMTTRRQRQQEGQSSQIVVEQPQLIRQYNLFMDGVDLHDNAVSNYRVSMRSKKWYWQLWLAILECSVVNAWKVNVLVNKKHGQPTISQLAFRTRLATDLLLTSDEDTCELVLNESDVEDTTSDTTFEPRQPLPRASGHHEVILQPQKKARRCQVCHKPTLRMCNKCQVHLHLKTCFATHHKW